MSISFLAPFLDRKLVSHSVCWKELRLTLANALNRLAKLGDVEVAEFVDTSRHD